MAALGDGPHKPGDVAQVLGVSVNVAALPIAPLMAVWLCLMSLCDV
jgi:hypothetical protein